MDDARIGELQARVEQLTAEREHYRELYLKLLEQCRKLERGIIAGQKAERLSPSEAQLSMAVLASLIPGDAAPDSGNQAKEPETERVREHERRKPTGRRPLPDNLPRVEIEVVPPEVEQEGKAAFDCIGQEVSETVERRPASLIVVRVKRPKFVRKDRERNAETDVFTSPPPELPIERGLAGPGMLADTIVRRWQDHLPLNRLESIYAREGLELDRSTICGWHFALTALAAPLVVAMWRDAFKAPYLCTDSTGVLVQAPEKCKRGHFWVVVAPERHVLYAYTASHDKAAVDTVLDGYKGYLVSDAHAVYDHLFATGEITEVGCWAHARRYFFKALESEPDLARQALAMIGALFRIERILAGQPPSKRRVERLRQSQPLIEQFFTWCDEHVSRVLEDTPIARAIGYARNQRQALSRFLNDERLPIHNNMSELALRREVVGRKNWLFLGSDEAGGVNATFVTLLASCRLHNIEPAAYMRDLFCLLPSWPQTRILELAPAYWNETLKQQDTQQRLAANVFRAASLGLAPVHREDK